MSAPQAAAWQQAGTLILHKMLGELSYEGLLSPQPENPPAHWLLELPDEVRYRFVARRGAFECWVVAPDSATRQAGTGPIERAFDPRALVVDARSVLGLTGLRLADVLAELTATITNEAARIASAPRTVELATMDYDRADGKLTGHPRLVLNKGRLGFAERDRAHYAPESGATFPVHWIAVRRELAEFRSVPGLTAEKLLVEELGAEKIADFTRVLAGHGDPADYVWLPVHPWQREEILGTLYAGEFATGQVVDLGISSDRYIPHQTVRTLANRSHDTRRDVKTALSVRNTLVYRGLASGATLAGPSVTHWLTTLHERDPLLSQQYRFGLLGEVASVSVRHPVFGALDELPYRFHETLGVLWREPIRTRVEPDQRAISYAALPYRDAQGVALISELIRASGLAPLEWLRRVLDLTLTPLLHWLLRYGVAFCPHGQNLILIVDAESKPVRAFIKDFAQGVDLLDEDLPEYAELAADARAGMLRWPAYLLAQSLFSSVFSGQLRFIAEILFDDFGAARTECWQLVRDIVADYRAAHPETASRLDDCRLFDETVERVCLNTEHLAGQGFDKVDRDDEFDVRQGMVRNPLAGPDPDGAW
ncbi:MAG TPA: IucA/IucC family protein [Pseudonocardiaceae bacterium]|nr:IucA/IucC family protein [Pseudonocardiaceae bacterium]